MPWGPVIDLNISMPLNDWYQGWSQADWYFTNDTVESFINNRKFNKNLAYMSGVTTQEAAYFLCKFLFCLVLNFCTSWLYCFIIYLL